MLEIANQAADVGAEIVARYFREGSQEARGKSGEAGYKSHELVTDADLESERAIAELIKSKCPGHEVLGEEFQEADLSAEHLWVVDPLDGTNNFAHGIPHWAISIAYYYQGRPQCGVVYNPIRNDRFEAERGQGAKHNGRTLQVSSATELNVSIVAAGFYYDRGLMMESTLNAIRDLFRAQVHGFRRFGTAALDLCQVALGWYGGYFEFELSPWDFAAGQLIVTEAGGRVTTCGGEPLPLAKSSILASNGPLHDPIRQIVEPHFVSSRQ